MLLDGGSEIIAAMAFETVFDRIRPVWLTLNIWWDFMPGICVSFILTPPFELRRICN